MGSANLPIFQFQTFNAQQMSQLQTTWANALNPVVGNPVSSATILTGIALITGANVINHLLQRVQQGWFILDIDAASTLYRSAPFNNLTLTLNASAPCTVNIGVF